MFGGKNESEAVMGGSHFLCLDGWHWTEVCMCDLHYIWFYFYVMAPTLRENYAALLDCTGVPKEEEVLA